MPDVVPAAVPEIGHRGARELVILEVVGLRVVPVHQMHQRQRSAVADRLHLLHLRIPTAFPRAGASGHRPGRCAAPRSRGFCRSNAAACSGTNVLGALGHLIHVFGQLSRAAEEIHLNDQRVDLRVLGDMQQRRVRHDAPVPVPFAVDLRRRERRRKRPARHDVARRDGMRGVVEIDRLARTGVDRAERQPHVSSVDEVEIDELVQRRAQRFRIVVTERRDAALGRESGCRNTGA